MKKFEIVFYQSLSKFNYCKGFVEKHIKDAGNETYILYQEAATAKYFVECNYKPKGGLIFGFNFVEIN